MSDRIVREDFSPAKHLPQVQQFDCGPQPWEVAVSEWIKGTDPSDSVVTDMAVRGTQVWVYYNQGDELVGFASLGKHEWSLPPYGKKKVPVVIVPNLAVAKRFHGLPAGDTYADQIMDDLAAEAAHYKSTHRAWVCVRPPDESACASFLQATRICDG